MRSRSLWFIVASLTAACAIESDEVTTAEAPQTITSRADTIVPPSIARAVAEAFSAEDGAPQKHVRAVSTMLDASGRTALYGVNFEEGGYVVLSAELDILPILAFSDEGTIDFANLREGEDGMIGELRGAIEKMRASPPGTDATMDEARTERIQWQPYLEAIASRGDVPAEELEAARAGTAEVCYPGPCVPEPIPYCTTTTKVTIGPLMSTWWDQGCNFNDKVPLAAGGPCGHAKVGCTAVAAGQVMRFHRKGFGSYNFDMMPNGAGGTSSQLLVRNNFLRDVAVGVKMKFGASSSGAYPSDVVAMLGAQGYAAYRSYIPYGIANTALGEIKAGRPLLMDGTNASGVGHMWVVDGSKQVKGVSPAGCKLKPGTVHAYFNHNFGHSNPTAWYADLTFGEYKYNKYLTTVRKL